MDGIQCGFMPQPVPDFFDGELVRIQALEMKCSSRTGRGRQILRVQRGNLNERRQNRPDDSGPAEEVVWEDVWFPASAYLDTFCYHGLMSR